MKRISNQCAALSQNEREDFNIRASFEEEQRHQALQTPLAPKGAPKPGIEHDVGRSALKKISVGRLQKNYEEAANHPLWSSSCQMGDCVLPRQLCLCW